MSDNSWYEKGELPPVGTDCEFRVIGKEWCNCTIIFHSPKSSNTAACYVHETGILVWSLEFRPIKTEREIAVEEMLTHMNSAWHKDLAAQLYDAGYRKTNTPD